MSKQYNLKPVFVKKIAKIGFKMCLKTVFTFFDVHFYNTRQLLRFLQLFGKYEQFNLSEILTGSN